MTDTYTPALPSEFQSGNEIPVERATFTRERMTEILKETIQSYQSHLSTEVNNAKQNQQ